MSDVRVLQRGLWGANLLLAGGIALFVWQVRLFSPSAGHLADFRPEAEDSRRTPARSPDAGDGALKSLANPLEKKAVAGGPKAPSLFKAVLKGTLPSAKEPRRGVAFIRASTKNTDLVAYVGEELFHEGKPFEEFRGWTLQEVARDRAVFVAPDGRREELVLDQTVAPAPAAAGGAPGSLPGAPGRVNRVGQAYSSENFKSRKLAASEGREVWGIDPDEVDWAMQNSERVMDQDFRVSPYAGGGLRIESVAAASIGAARGLVSGDVIREINGQPLSNVAEVRSLFNNPAMRSPQGMRVTVERAGRPMTIEFRPLPR
jgi:type II secretory pathway component PulC